MIRLGMQGMHNERKRKNAIEEALVQSKGFCRRWTCRSPAITEEKGAIIMNSYAAR